MGINWLQSGFHTFIHPSKNDSPYSPYHLTFLKGESNRKHNWVNHPSKGDIMAVVIITPYSIFLKGEYNFVLKKSPFTRVNGLEGLILEE